MSRGTIPLAALAAIALAVACTQSSDAPTAATREALAAHGDHGRASGAPTEGQLQLAARVRAATAALADRDAAVAAGYSAQFPAGCAAAEGVGAQGFHYLNESLVDGKTDPLRPELVMYEPQADGSLVLVGVDYIIPFTEWKAPQPPRLHGVEFGRLEALGVWALHIWTERANPAGLFAAWNPAVSCRYAALAH